MNQRGDSPPALSLAPSADGGLPPADRPGDPAVELCPDWLTPQAREHWARLAPTIYPPLRPCDVPAFAMLVNALATYTDADAIVQGSGLLITDGGNSLVVNPALGIRDRCSATIASLAGRFHMTPADRPLPAEPPADRPRVLPTRRESGYR